MYVHTTINIMVPQFMSKQYSLKNENNNNKNNLEYVCMYVCM